MQIKQTEFRYKGERDYIHGSDMFQVMMDLDKPAASLENVTFTIHEFVHSALCKRYLTGCKESLIKVDHIAVRCQLDIDGVTHWMAIAPDDKEQGNAGRYAYDESQIISMCAMQEDSIALNSLSPYSFIETVVAMNKHMHQQLFPDVTGQWVFTRIDLPALCDARENLAIRLRHNMNYRLTKSDIEQDGKKIGDIFFSLVNT